MQRPFDAPIMGVMVQRYAPDTNFFMHARAARELPWAEITDADSIELVVLDEVVSELDKHKSGGNGRRARRARAAFEVLDPLFDDDLAEVVVREAQPRVVYRIAPVLPGNRTKPEQLDISTADGRIVEQALSVRELLGGALNLLTHDRGPRRLAKVVGLQATKVPESWLLPAEPDDRDKEMGRLKEQVRILSQRTPCLTIGVDQDGKSVERIEGALPRFRPLSVEFIEGAMEAVKRQHKSRGLAPADSITVTLQSDIERYKRRRREWLAKIEDQLKHYSGLLTLRDGMCCVDLVVQNSGSAPAEGLVVEVSAEGPIKLINPAALDDFFSDTDVRFPEPPVMQRTNPFGGPFSSELPEIASHLYQHLIPPPVGREPDRFYWDYDSRDIVVDRVVGRCGEFRHNFEPEVLTLKLFVAPNDQSEPVGCIRLRCSAKNLPETIEENFPVALHYDWKDADELARRQLFKELFVKWGT